MIRDSRDLAACHPALKVKAEALIAAFWERFAPFYLTPVFTQRSPETQDALWAQGRTTLEVVNNMRDRAGLAPITVSENMAQVTWTRNSRHLLVPSEAIDFAITLDPDGPTGPLKPTIKWDDMPRYRAMGIIAEELGLRWGGEKDGGHVQLPPDVPQIEARS